MSNSAFEGRIFEPRYVFGWLLFTLSAGIVNAGAVLASNTVVSHITGNVTALALDASLGVTLLVVVALFVVGAILASLLAESLSSKPALGFALPITFAAALLLTTAIAGKSGLFGVFGAAHEMTSLTFVMLGLLALAMGMVNAAVAGATNNQVRTTHLSGPATDLAGNVVRGFLDTGKGKLAELRWAGLRIAMLVSFACGGLIAAKLGAALRYDVFVVGAGTLVVALGLCTASIAERSELGRGISLDPKV